MEQKMKWYLLKSNKCPKCGLDLYNQEGDCLVKCSSFSCDFAIMREKFESIVGKMYKRTVDISSYRGGIEPEDLQKRECSFCHSVHGVDQKCEGFN